MSRPWQSIGLLLVLLGAVLTFEIYDEREKTLLNEQQRLISLANALKANIGEQLRASSRMLDGLRHDLPDLLARPDGVARLNNKMALLTESVIGIRSLLLINADGTAIASNRAELIGQNFKDSERYQVIKTGNDPTTLYISPPFKTPLGIFTTSFGKAIVGTDGRFDGYLLAILDPAYFGVLMQSLLYAHDMRLSVAHGDGKVIFSTQATPEILGFDLSKKPDSLFNQHLRSGRESSFMVDRATATNDLRLVAIQTILPIEGTANTPLVVAVSRESDAAIAEWKRSSQQQGILFIGIVLAVCAGYYVYSHRKQAYRLLHLEKTRVEEASEERIREVNEQFRGYFENMAVGAVQLDADGKFQLVNERYCEMTGYDRQELLNKMQPAQLTHPDDRANEQEHMRQLFAENGSSLDLEKRVVCKNGEVIWVHVSAHAVRGQEGKVKFTTAVIEDITLRKQLMAELEGARVAAEAANRAKTLFLGNMSHEMRTPLHQISGVAGMFRRDSLSDKQSHRLGMLETAVKRLDTVIGGILTLVDIEAGSTEVKLVPIDMDQLVIDVTSLLAERASAKNMTIHHEVSNLPSPLMGDARHLTTILSCYCNNAITFSERGVITIRVRKLNEDMGSIMVRLEVQDQGVGIDPNQIGRLFEHFEQADNSHTRKYGGTGVGLAIVKKLTKLMGGDAGCESILGSGSTFWATIKLAKGDPKSEAQSSVAEDFQI